MLLKISINLSFRANVRFFLLMLYLILDRTLTQFLRANTLQFVSPNRYSRSVFVIIAARILQSYLQHFFVCVLCFCEKLWMGCKLAKKVGG